jgi:hypothetical protein
VAGALANSPTVTAAAARASTILDCRMIADLSDFLIAVLMPAG